MLSKNWKTSERKYGVVVERNLRIPMRDGVHLHADLFRPDAPGGFPAILGYHPYDPVAQWAPIFPTGFASVSAAQQPTEVASWPITRWIGVFIWSS